MKTRKAILLLLAVAMLQPLFAHYDRIVRLEEGELVGLPPKYQPALFSLRERKLVIGRLSVVLPDCVWSRFGRIVTSNFRFQASWYHDPSLMPPYIQVTVDRPEAKFSHRFLINLDTLTLISFEEGPIDSDGTSYDAVSLDEMCVSSWKITRTE